jgi:hypothetical protein
MRKSYNFLKCLALAWLELADQCCDLLRLGSASHFAKALFRAMQNGEALLALAVGNEDRTYAAILSRSKAGNGVWGFLRMRWRLN